MDASGKRRKWDLERHQRIANLRGCPYCGVLQGELCWDGTAYLIGKEKKARHAHYERGDEYGPESKFEPRNPIQKFGKYGGWNPYGIR